MSNSLPTVTSNIPRDLRNFVDRLRDIVTGGGANRLVSAQDLADAGLANINVRGALSPAVTETPVYGPPPAPTNVAASAAIQNVILTWDYPLYQNHAYAEVWGADTNDIGTAVLLGLAPGAIYTDPLGPGKTRYYWVRYVNTQYTTGPYNALAGTPATTPQDLAYTMDLLAAAYGDTSEAPFFQLNSPQVINGVTIPAGTYMKAGFIYDGVITNAKIGNAAVDNAKIASLSADKLTAGTIAADRLTAAVINAKVTNIDAAVIQSGFIDAARINTASIASANITAAQIASGTIDSARIGNLDASKITTGTMNADRIDAATLSAITADLGTITAGTLTFTLDANNYLKIDGANQRIEVWAGGARRVVLGKL
jgi:hypothetical protein